MIIWINGAFGSGKTHTAYELNRRIKNSHVYDPEEIGFFIRDNVPIEIRLDDFQDYTLWREFNFKMLEYLDKTYDGIIIVPMTLINKQYFVSLVCNLQDIGIEVRHFTLMASKETLLKRLRRRGDTKKSWPAKQINRCVEALGNPIFNEHIKTDNMCIDEVVEYIATSCGINLLKDNRNIIKKKFHRISLWMKHIRLFR